MSDTLTIRSYTGEYFVKYIETLEFSNFIRKNDYLVIDKNISNLYPEIRNSFDNEVYELEADESSKTLLQVEILASTIIEKGFKKNHRLVAIGGGITQDVVGFLASIIYRGVEWMFIPTTLLAQADSCIGSKTSINFSTAKNLLGTFHPPREIISCPKFIDSLETSDIKSGIGEMLHYFLIYDTSIAELLMSDYDQIIQGDYGRLESYIKQSLEMKKHLVEIDEFDNSERRVYNYGHTFGHAIESLSKYKVPHGQAVTLGMDMANFLSYKLDYINYQKYDKLHQIIRKNIPDFNIQPDQLKEYMSLLSKDKKNIDDSIVCILPEGDKIKVKKITNKDKIKKYISEYFKIAVEEK
tara:strand:- start:1118 stop:2179 length:1062 start_codon:yes stop_codon:yes gene_type:complete